MTEITPLPSPSIPTLVVVADQDEVTDLIPANAELIWQVPSSGANEQMAWQFDNLVVVVTGSGGPAIAAVTARFLAKAPLGRPFEQVVNFGSCGRYGWSGQTELCGAYFVSESRQWDLFFNFRGVGICQCADAYRPATPGRWRSGFLLQWRPLFHAR